MQNYSVASVVGVAAAATALVGAVALARATAREQPQGSGCLGSPRDGLVGLIGDTPLVRLAGLSAETGCDVLAKCEFLNPGGSSKDRVARNIVLEAERAGLLVAGGTIVEGTSGSTGISLAAVARARGYRCVIVMPDDQAVEKREMLALLGAEVELVRPASIVNDGHYVNVARRRAAEIPGGFFANQFENLANFRAHLLETGPEIWRQAKGRIDAFVMSAGTGGTVAGVGTFLKSQDPGVQVVLADPQGSSLFHKVNDGVLFAREQGERRLQRHRDDTLTEGIGLDRLTANFAAGLDAMDVAYRVTDAEVVAMSRRLLRREGLFVGSSSALNLVAARRAAIRLGPGHTVVTVICGGGARERTKLYNDDYLRGRGLQVPSAEALAAA